MADWRDAALRGRPELRLVPAGALHVTLVFLGGRESGQLEVLAETAFAALQGLEAPLLTPTGVRSVPTRRTRLLALALADENGRAAAASAAASGALAEKGLHEPELRPFWAHATLARVRSGARLPRVELPPPPDGGLRADTVTLYRSHLSAKGTRYEPLRRLELG